MSRRRLGPLADVGERGQVGERLAAGGRSGSAARTMPPVAAAATDEEATKPPTVSVDAHDAVGDVLDLARPGGERQRGAALLLAGGAARRSRGCRRRRRRDGLRLREAGRAGAVRAAGALAAARAARARVAAARRRDGAAAARRARSRRCRAVDASTRRPTTTAARTQAKRGGGQDQRAPVGFRPRPRRRVRGGRGKPAAARASSSRAHVGSGRGGSSRSSAPSSSSSGGRVSGAVIDGLPELGHGAVEERAGVGGADAEHGGDLGVVEPGVELQGDHLAVARRAGAASAARTAARSSARSAASSVRRRGGVLRVGGQRGGALAAAQLVERGVAGDAEQPGALAAPAGVVGARPCGRPARRPGRSRPRRRRGRAAAWRRRRTRRRARRGTARRSRAPVAWLSRGSSVTLIVLTRRVLRRAGGTITTPRGRYRSSGMRPVAAACLAIGCALLAPRRRPGAPRPTGCGRRSTCATRPSTRTRSACAPRCRGRRAAPRGSMRFRLQWRDGDTVALRGTAPTRAGGRSSAPAGARSSRAGASSSRRRRARSTFRGVVRFRWRRDGRDGRAARLEITEPGHRSTAGADPTGYSAATCSIGG